MQRMWKEMIWSCFICGKPMYLKWSVLDIVYKFSGLCWFLIIQILLVHTPLQRDFAIRHGEYPRISISRRLNLLQWKIRLSIFIFHLHLMRISIMLACWKNNKVLFKFRKIYRSRRAQNYTLYNISKNRHKFYTREDSCLISNSTNKHMKIKEKFLRN